MASKRQKVMKNIKLKDYNTLILSDVLCPICRSIMTDPVSLPCDHDFCLSCFEDTMKNVNLVCPLCKVRVGSWWRKTKKEGKHLNVELWKAIKERFSQQVINKLTGIEEDLAEKHKVIVAHPGEIRKEYELQKQREDEELQKKRELEERASEELIKSMKDEEEFQQAVREEKLKLDEDVAKKLAAEMSFSSPSTSKMNLKKLGPMDKFVKKGNETVKSQAAEADEQLNNNFATKEYTCRVLCMDKNERENQKRVSSPIIRRKILQMKKIVENDTHSDSSDCIESEMRYFKPIDHKMNPPSEGKTPIKVLPKKPRKLPNPKILSPSGSINIVFSNFFESAFARASPRIMSPPLSSSADIENSCGAKRLCSDQGLNGDNNKKLKSHAGKPSSMHNCSIMPKNCGSEETNNSSSSSPLFFGFANMPEENKEIIVRWNGKLTEENVDLERKLLQEKLDLEFAKKLQEDFDRAADIKGPHRATRNSKRQATLDEMVKRPHRVK